jgi:hypothetical protein
MISLLLVYKVDAFEVVPTSYPLRNVHPLVVVLLGLDVLVHDAFEIFYDNAILFCSIVSTYNLDLLGTPS